MTWYPADTEKLLSPSDRSNIDHLWYKVNYDQLGVKDTLKKGKPEKLFPHFNRDINLKRSMVGKLQTMIRQRETALYHMQDRYLFRILTANARNGLIHGLGSAHVRESGLTIHPVYGCPYIPASSLKGIVRRWAIKAFLDGENDLGLEDCGDPEKNVAIKKINQLMGTQGRRGIARFYDLFLIDQCTLHADLNTRLYSIYYENKGADAEDTMDAVPSGRFYTVTASNIEIIVGLHTVKKDDAKDTGSHAAYDAADFETDSELLKNWTCRALTELGIGSRSSAGFGFLTDLKEITTDIFSEIEQSEKEKQEKIQAMQAEQERREKIAGMSDEERLSYQIAQLDPNDEQDRQASKSEYYNQVIELKSKKAAEQLRAYWKQIDAWKKPSKKQKEKVKKIKSLIED